MGNTRSEDRQQVIQRFCQGKCLLSICTSMGYSRPWFYKLLHRYLEESTDWFAERAPRHQPIPTRVPTDIEDLLTLMRLELYNKWLCCGVQAILWTLENWRSVRCPRCGPSAGCSLGTN